MKSLAPINIHYLASVALLGIYGVKVCPFLDTLTLVQLLTPILATFACMYGIRKALQSRLESREVRNQIGVQFKLDFLLFIAGGGTLAVFNFIVFNFPPGSGLKVIVGMFVLGFFIACDLGLRRERSLAMELNQSGQHLEIDYCPYPLTKKFAWFAGLSLTMLGTVIALVMIKNLLWLTNLDSEEEMIKAAMLVALDIGFILFVMIGYILAIVTSYGSNLQLFLNFQQSALNQVAKGQLSARVPVASNDEFGIIASHTNKTIESLRLRTQELHQMRDVTIVALSSLAETRDNETGAHILRTQQYVKVLAEQLQPHPRFKSVLTPSMTDLIYKSAPLHDLGKVGIPDAILLKPGRLTDEEFAVMKEHPSIGSQALQAAQGVMENNSFLGVACEIMETHHEKWDGTGYPAGLAGEQIPVSGRLMALADVYDALISERVYKAAFSHEKATQIIVEGKGTHFDPDVVDAFLAKEKAFKEIAARFSESELIEQQAA